MSENQKVEHIHKTDYQYNFVNEVSLTSLNCSVLLRSSDPQFTLNDLINSGLSALKAVEESKS